MNRKNSYFEGSRLYRQASKGSQELLTRFSRDLKPFEKPIREISDGNLVCVLSGIEESYKKLKLADSYASNICSSISPYIAIPILLQAANDIYYDSANQNLKWIGPAIKSTISLIWGNFLYQGTHSQSKAITDIGDAVAALAMRNLIRGVISIYEVFGENTVELGVDGLNKAPDEIYEAKASLDAALEGRGQTHRTVNDSIEALIRKPTKALEAIGNILRGDRSENQEAFKGTFFGKLSVNEPAEFWLGIYYRIFLRFSSIKTRYQVMPEEPKGLSILGYAPIIDDILEGIDRGLRQDVLSNLFWQKNWYFQRLKTENHINMIVERPLLTISRNPDLFATTTTSIMDSLTWFVEASVMSYPEAGGVALSSSVFNNLISKPFENQVIALLQSYGFLAGQVTESGSWLVGDQSISLTSHLDTKIPGEIDVLAWHQHAKQILVIECKVISLPLSTNRWRNIVQKLSQSDGDGYYAKLRRKIDWLRSVENFSSNFWQGFVLLDRKISVAIEPIDELLTVDFESFSSCLKDFRMEGRL